MPRITLIGYRGSGKTTIASLLAKHLDCSWIDADAVIESHVGSSIATFMSSYGEAAFRDKEASILASEFCKFDGVLATGGGIVLRPENRSLLREAFFPVVWLTAPGNVIRRRLAADPSTASRRPALSGRDPLDEVAEALVIREPLYKECANHIVDVSKERPEVLAEAIVSWLQKGLSP